MTIGRILESEAQNLNKAKEKLAEALAFTNREDILNSLSECIVAYESLNVRDEHTYNKLCNAFRFLENYSGKITKEIKKTLLKLEL